MPKQLAQYSHNLVLLFFFMLVQPGSQRGGFVLLSKAEEEAIRCRHDPSLPRPKPPLTLWQFFKNPCPPALPQLRLIQHWSFCRGKLKFHSREGERAGRVGVMFVLSSSPRFPATWVAVILLHGFEPTLPHKTEAGSPLELILHLCNFVTVSLHVGFTRKKRWFGPRR